MSTLTIPDALKAEFATVEALWAIDAKTKWVDALILTWVKYEKQTRRLFSFLVLQNPDFDASAQDACIATIVSREDVYPRDFLAGIEALAGRTLADLMGATHAQLEPEIRRVQNYRNKIFHGQLTGQHLQSAQLEADVRRLIVWIEALSAVGTRTFGYDGLERDTKRLAGKRKPKNVTYPFQTAADFETWLTGIAPPKRRRTAKPAS